MGCTSLKSLNILSIEKFGLKYKVTYSDNSIYMGELQNHKREGFGYYRFNKIEEYHGNWRNDLRSGKGECTKSNKDHYKGNWENNQMSGFGILTSKILGCKYKGQWQQNRPHGSGVYKIEGPVKIEGTWKFGYLEGPGKVIWTNGWSISGTFTKNRLNNNVQIEGPDTNGAYIERYDIEIPIIGRGFFPINYRFRVYEGQFEGIFIINGTDIFKGLVEFNPEYLINAIDDPQEIENIEKLSESLTFKGIYYWPNGNYMEGIMKCQVFLLSDEEDKDVIRGYNGDWVSGRRKLEWDAFLVLDGEGVMCENEENCYEGKWEMGEKHGFGIMTWVKSAKKYTGHWENGIYNGFGVLYSEQDEVFEGVFENGIFITGKATYNDGSSFIGRLKDNILLIGELKYPNSDYYIGQLNDKHRSGKGTMYWNNGDTYQGDWVNDLQHGKGTFTYKNGDYYIGSWVKGKRHGIGFDHIEPTIPYLWEKNLKIEPYIPELAFKVYDKAGLGLIREENMFRLSYSGDLYVFTDVENEDEHVGILWKNNGEVYEGKFENYLPAGKGTYKTNNGTWIIGEFLWENLKNLESITTECTSEASNLIGTGEIHLPNGCIIKGQWENSQIIKQAECFFPDGSIYIGEMKNSLPDGKGKMSNPIGQIYEGEFKEGKKHGYGYYIDSNESYKGMWYYDKKQGTGISKNLDDTLYTGMWKKDKKHGPCTIVLANKEKFLCEFVNDEVLEPGTLITTEGTMESKLWKDGKVIDYEESLSSLFADESIVDSIVS
ncbi:hypothetical protein SteCoe_30161 [Stentor coeruleus]|uniref:MORN repeat protein n=1 Tax=Stentor coeruleus TaxID=5963 RepID=A0A1R2B469_9CILI|nr:hypothetical protein SteCoe_30161 [Stentor coeruleus]